MIVERRRRRREGDVVRQTYKALQSRQETGESRTNDVSNFAKIQFRRFLVSFLGGFKSSLTALLQSVSINEASNQQGSLV